MSASDTLWFNMQLSRKKKQAKEDLEKAEERYKKLEEMSKCQHEVIDTGSFFCANYLCTKCGFEISGD